MIRPANSPTLIDCRKRRTSNEHLFRRCGPAVAPTHPLECVLLDGRGGGGFADAALLGVWPAAASAGVALCALQERVDRDRRSVRQGHGRGSDRKQSTLASGVR